jgi:chemotaxis protein CheD
MRQLVVGVADGLVTQDRDASLVTYALGSCVAVAMWDREAGTGGLVHYMLPESSLDAEKAAQNPWMFADTGIARLLERMLACGATKRRLRVWAAGGSQVMDPTGVFNIGKRNYLAMRKWLWKAGVMLAGEDVGGAITRTVKLDVGTGQCWVRAPGAPDRLL